MHNKGICICDESKCPLIHTESETSQSGPAPTPKELTDEIKSFRQKNKEFQATNDHEFYLVVAFSCKEDKRVFLKNVGLEKEHTFIDGYELSRNINCEPAKPSFKLRGPLDK